MPIRPEHMVLDMSEKINTSKTLCNILNAYIQQAFSGEARLRVSRVDFMSRIKTAPLLFRIKLDHALYPDDLPLCLNQLSDLLHSDRRQTHTQTKTTEFYISNAGSILHLFKSLGYETPLTDESFCLAYQVDLLQGLLADTLQSIIKKCTLPTSPPEQFEFDGLGQVSGVVVAPNGVKYKLKNTDEVCGFLKQYGRYDLPAHFVELLRRQMVINAARLAEFLVSENSAGMPMIFADNHFESVQLLESKKQLSLSLTRRDALAKPLNQQERRLFQDHFTRILGREFGLDWHVNGAHDRLIISSARAGGFIPTDIDALIHAFHSNQLLTSTQTAALALQRLIGAPSPVVHEIPGPIEDILACKIRMTLPDGTPHITPMGHSYDFSAIVQHIEFNPIDPTCREALTLPLLRPNLLAERLIEYYTREVVRDDPSVHAPALLIHPDTGLFYDDPIVLPTGETANRSEHPEQSEYPNRCIADLISYYSATLVARDASIARAGIRATIGANIGMLCPGAGAVSEESARDETNIALPYVEYNVLASTLTVHFISQEYARRFELSLKRLNMSLDLSPAFIPFSSENISIHLQQSRRSVPKVDGTPYEQLFHATVLIRGHLQITCLFERLCGLSPTYFTALQALSGSADMDRFNHVIQEVHLDDWAGKEAESICEQLSWLTVQTPTVPRQTTILSVRAQSDLRRMTNEPMTTIREEEVDVDEAAVPTSASSRGESHRTWSMFRNHSSDSNGSEQSRKMPRFG